jgi:hypothetical protein
MRLRKIEYLVIIINKYFIFSILSKILTVSESTLIYRKRLRSIYRDSQNEQRTVRQIQHGRMKYVQNEIQKKRKMHF